MSSQEAQRRRSSPIPLEIGIALLAAGLSWVAVPSSGVIMHWDGGGVAGWSMNAAGYASVAAVATFVIGHFITRFAARKTGFAYTWLAPTAVGVYWVAFAAFQRLWLGAGEFVFALGLAAIVYFVLLWLTLRRAAGRADGTVA
ncbi:hypothetical protein ACI1US_01854 [Leucobacter sp. BZR 635]